VLRSLTTGEVRESQEAVLHLSAAEYPEARSQTETRRAIVWVTLPLLALTLDKPSILVAILSNVISPNRRNCIALLYRRDYPGIMISYIL